MDSSFVLGNYFDIVKILHGQKINICLYCIIKCTHTHIIRIIVPTTVPTIVPITVPITVHIFFRLLHIWTLIYCRQGRYLL